MDKEGEAQSALSSAIAGNPTATATATPSNTKSRSFSDPPSNKTLAPSPNFKEASRDDHALLVTTPRPSRRPDLLSRGLTLHLPPPRVTTDVPVVSPFAPPLLPPLSPNAVHTHLQSPDLSSHSHSPATSLPRHSRGLDFSRACTNLHHSTIAEQSSPDSSPVITQKGMAIPGRRLSMSSMLLDSPGGIGPPSMPWGMLGGEKSTVSSSVGSVNMMISESETSDSDDDASMGGGDDDPMFTTPQVHKLQNPLAPTPFNPPATPGAGGGAAWGSGTHFSPAQASLMKTMRRSRMQKSGKRSRKGSSSASGSGYSSMASPRNTSPPPLRSIESASNGGYFTWANAARSRRESVAMGNDGLNLSSGNDSGDEASLTAPSTPGVVRRPVTRRGNLLPKTKGFARIRAALAEEAAPVDTDTRKEAETIRQVRERDNTAGGEFDFATDRPQTATAASSPSLLPAVPESAQEDFGRELEVENSVNRGLGLGANFSLHASRNSGGLDYWNRFDPSMRTPPPPNFARQSSSAASDINFDSPMGDFSSWRRPRARSSASDASEAFQPITSGVVAVGVHDDMHLKKFKKRAREDDFDIATIKRRAVSPGMSAQNSPVLANSPSTREANGGGWGQPPDRREGKEFGSNSNEFNSQTLRCGSAASSTSMTGNMVNQGKKLGLQPMTDTNDGLMKMSIG